MYKILLVVAIIVGIGWIAYGIWWVKVCHDEKKEPKPREKSEQLKKAQQSMAEYAKKMASYDYKKKTQEQEEKNGG
jgi:H+/gluconate symporter-like permease